MSKILFKDVLKIYPGAERPAVNKVNFEVQTGEFIVILGTSGCGKTTLLKMVNRLYEMTDGSIIIDDIETRELAVNELRRKIGYVIQQSGLFPHMTVEQNIGVVPEMLGWDKNRIKKRAEELLRLVHLDPKIYQNRYPRQLSGGQQQRIGLARALAADPPIMLMDEPFGAIDAITRTKLQDELVYIQKKLHKTILFVTHDVEEALRLADKIVIMKDGNIIQYDTPFNIITNPKNDFVRDLIGGDDIIRQLSFINVKVAMQKVSDKTKVDSSNSIPETLDLKSVIIHMLKYSAESLYVVDENKNVKGKVDFARIQTLLKTTTKNELGEVSYG